MASKAKVIGDPIQGTNYNEWGVQTRIDEDNGQFIITVPFADERLPYYPVQVAALIAGRSSTSIYRCVSLGRWDMEGAEIEGVLHVSHASLVNYLKIRDETADQAIARRKATLHKIAKGKPKRTPAKPRPVVATTSAQELLASGTLDFLDSLDE